MLSSDTLRLKSQVSHVNLDFLSVILHEKLEFFSSNCMNESENSNRPTDLTSMKEQEFLL